MGRHGLYFFGSGQEQVTVACECGNDLSGSIKFGKVLDKLRTSYLLMKYFSVELVVLLDS